MTTIYAGNAAADRTFVPMGQLSPTGRLSVSAPEFQELPRDKTLGARELSARLAQAMRMTEHQRLLMRTAQIHGTVNVAGQALTCKDLNRYFSGVQYPKDLEMAKELGLPARQALDFSELEKRVLPSIAPDA